MEYVQYMLHSVKHIKVWLFLQYNCSKLVNDTDFVIFTLEFACGTRWSCSNNSGLAVISLSTNLVLTKT